MVLLLINVQLFKTAICIQIVVNPEFNLKYPNIMLIMEAFKPNGLPFGKTKFYLFRNTERFWYMNLEKWKLIYQNS